MLGYTIEKAVLIMAEVIEIAILVRILISFIDSLRYNKFADLIYQITEPILYPCRMLLDKIGLGNGMIDLSPIVAYFFLRLIVMLVLSIF